MKEQMQFPEIFNTGEIPEGMSDKELLAHALCAWGVCMAGHRPQPSFGYVMAKVADRLGTATPDGLLSLAKRINSDDTTDVQTGA